MLVALCLTPAVSVPLAVAQSAGDDQYSDPFENTGGGKTSGGSSKGSGSKSSSGNSGAAQPAPAAATPAAPTQPGVSQLPRTGLDLRPLVAAGLVLLIAGFALVRWSGAAR